MGVKSRVTQFPQMVNLKVANFTFLRARGEKTVCNTVYKRIPFNTTNFHLLCCFMRMRRGKSWGKLEKEVIYVKLLQTKGLSEGEVKSQGKTKICNVYSG